MVTCVRDEPPLYDGQRRVPYSDSQKGSAVPTTIEWTNETWNPTTGCERVSPGCDNCYALRFAERFRGVRGHYFERGFDVELRPNMLGRPGSWRKPRIIFVNSMSDLFHRLIPDAYVDRVMVEIEQNPRHTYQLLTKRPERMRRYFRRRYGDHRLPDQLWVGVSIESNDVRWRADMLRSVNAATRFLSVEPMIGPIDRVAFDGISWVIVGGESGPRRRPLEASWVQDVRDRCEHARVAFFFKQWHKGKTGRLLDGRTWDQMPNRVG
jgi:protein gp37